MSDKFVSLRNLQFLLYEVHDLESLTQYPRFNHNDRDTFDLGLSTAFRMGRDLLRPMLEEMDRQAPVYEDGRVKVHPAVRTFMAECGDGGWISASSFF